MARKETSEVPGRDTPLKGSTTLGYYGTVEDDFFPTTSFLRNTFNITLGNTQIERVDWFKFRYAGKTLFIPRLPLTSRTTWNHLAARNLVYGNQIFEWKGQSYRIRLMKGADSDPTSFNGTGYLRNEENRVGTRNSEWSQLFIRISNAETSNPLRAQWASFSNAQLGVTRNSPVAGIATLCQEGRSDLTHVVYRGYLQIDGVSLYPVGFEFSDGGWRPVLELVE